MAVSEPACEHCGAAMEPKSYRGNPKRFCSELCRTRAYRANNPEYVAKRREAQRLARLAKSAEREKSLPPKPRCLNCGGELAVRSARARYCNASACQAAAKAAARRSNPPCSVEGCGRGVLARGYCPSHYKSEYHVPKFGTSPKKLKTRTCVCGAEVESRAGKQKYCSDACRYAWRDVEVSDSREVVRWRKPVVRRALHEARGPRRWTAGACAHCGAGFVGEGGDAAYCSDGCAKRASWARRYKRRGEFYVTPRVRLSVYERDGWVCQLCGGDTAREYEATNPLSPTLDHIVPRSLQAVPDDSKSNLRLAHMMCNALRSNNVDWAPDVVLSA